MADGFAAFADLHRPGAPFLLPNAWDVASAALLAAAGFPAVGTTSLGVAAGHGLPDGAAATRRQTLDLARAVARLPVLTTVDIEHGFSDDPHEVADLVAQLHGYGVVGVNIEDGRPDGTLAPVARQVRVLAAVRSAAPEVFLNARTDTHWERAEPLAQTLIRVAAYRDAGAHGIFVPGLHASKDIAAVVRAAGLPVNVLADRPLADLASLGVARVSCGSLLYRAGLAAAVATARSLAAGQPPPQDVPGYATVAAAGLTRR